MTFRAVSIGFSAAVLALACGSDSNNTPSDKTGSESVQSVPPPDTVAVQPTKPETCDDNPLLAGCPAPPSANGAQPPAATTPVTKDSPADLAKAAAENILNSNCGQCHGGQLTPATAQAGMNYINDIDKLVQNGKIIPLNSAGSLIIQRMERGEMPPSTSGKPPVNEADINTVAQYIDNPVFWPNVSTPDCSSKNQLTTFDDLFISINQDLIQQRSEDTPFFRYISLSNRFTAGECADKTMDQERQAMLKMVNMLSIDARPADLVAVDKNQTIYRLDIRDVQWDRGISVNGTAFADVWEAIAANNPFNVEFIGDDANQAKLDTVTQFPVMMSDQMMKVATIGNLYYAIIDVDVNQTLGNFILNNLGIDVNQNLLDRKQLRAGTTKSRVTRQDRLVERDDIENRAGALWQSFDFEANNANQSIFQDPFAFAPGGSEAIFSLPNGMNGFIIADANDNIVQDSDILLDTSQNNFRAVTSISCSNCHAAGFIPVVDEVRDVALSNARSIGLNRDEIEQLQEVYDSPANFAKQVQNDNSSFYQSALQRVSLPTQGVDPVSAVWLGFDADVTLARAAGDLGLVATELKDNIDLLNPVASVLRASTLDRDDFAGIFIDSLCILSTNLENQPDPAVCAQFAQP
jgi:mono/diheme cytochrome c family protein